MMPVMVDSGLKLIVRAMHIAYADNLASRGEWYLLSHGAGTMLVILP